ncbi:hypothetical protein [Pseudoalteromonas maricaloris]|uniref:hypothetical protein n=1 Tax=Pseudoalteromonas maricaloris TaxID=184924 RepID=UPI003C28B495
MLNTFTEDELPCFLRAQYEVIEAIAKGEGLKYLFLASFYSKWGIDTYFRNGERKYFDFFSDVIKKNIKLTLDFCPKANGVDLFEEGFFSEIRDYKFVIVPADVNNLFYAKYYKQGGWGHYFCLKSTSLENELTCVFDNLHLHVSDYSMRYTYFNLDLTLLQGLINDYQMMFLPNKQRVEQSIHQCNTMWYIGIGEEGDDKSTFSEQVFLEQLKNIMRQSLNGTINGFDSIDKFHIEKIQDVYFLGKKDKIEGLIKRYMIDIQFSNVYLKILASLDIDKSLFEEIESINEKSDKVRNMLFVMVVAGMVKDKSLFAQSLESLDDNNHKVINIIKSFLGFVAPHSTDDKCAINVKL